jgi:glycosyltransferase involved in cell wall biosynthesis
LLQGAGFDRAFFWPHAVESELVGSGSAEKIYDVVFLGSCYDYESLRVSWRQQNPESVNKVLDDAIDLVFGDNRTSLSEALAKAWEAAKLPSRGVDFAALFYYLDNYTRGRDRVELIRAIKDVPVHVFGSLAEDNAVGMLGWAPYLAACKNVTVHSAVSFAEGLNIQRKAKIALNSAPFFKNGSHERVLTALACGALPLTTDTAYFRSQFKEGEEIAFYQPANRELANDIVKNYLHDEGRRQQMVLKGAQKVAEKFTWDVRADQLLQAIPAIFSRVDANVLASPERPREG